MWECSGFWKPPLKRLNKKAIGIADSHGGKATARSGYRIDATGAELWLSMEKEQERRLVSWSMGFDGAIGAPVIVVLDVFCDALYSVVRGGWQD